MPHNPIELSVVLPAFNEGPYIVESIQRLKSHLEKHSVSYQIIVVDDGSTDDTPAKAREYQSRRIEILSYRTNRGKGYAVRHGMLHAQGRYRLFMDVDLSTSLTAIDSFLSLMHKHPHDVVIGNRKTKESVQKIKQPFYRRFLGKGFTLLSRWLMGVRITDFTCGFKMFTATAAETIFRRQKIFDWAFDAELIYIARLHRLTIHEVPVTWQHHADSKVRILRDILRSLTSLARIRWYGMKGYYR